MTYLSLKIALFTWFLFWQNQIISDYHDYFSVFCFCFFLPNFKVDEELVTNSGKFLILDRMLPELKTRGHKVVLLVGFFWLFNYSLLIGIDTKIYLNFRCCSFHKWQECWTFWWTTAILEISTLVGLMDPCLIQRERKM